MACKRCFKHSCELEVQYVCKCSSPEIYSCDFHFKRHLKLTNKTHCFDSTFLDPYKGAKKIIKGLVGKDNHKKEKFRKKAYVPSDQSNNIFKNNLKNIKLDSEELKSQRSIALIKNINLAANDDFRRAYLFRNDSTACDSSEIKISEENLSAYNKFSALYMIDNENEKNSLHVYDIKSGIEEIKVLDTAKRIDIGVCIAQLPNGELFCFGSMKNSESVFIIGKNFEVRVLPPRELCYCSSAVYYNRTIYCFGGMDQYGVEDSVSKKFDLDENRWITLAWMPEWNSGCSTAIFNENILVSGFSTKNILIYSIDIDSFSTIPYNFGKSKRKILINVERLYLIECGFNGKIYESEAENEYAWNKIANSKIKCNYPAQVYYSHDKGGIYIAASLKERYYKFDLEKKIMTKF